MLEIKMKSFASSDFRKNESGFTLISVLIALSILISLIPLSAYLLRMVNYHTSYDELSVRQFFVYFRDELIQAQSYEIYHNNKQITFYLMDEREANFILYENNVLRRIDGGYEIYLRGVEQLIFKDLPYNGVRLKLTTDKGETYAKNFVFYS